VSTRTQLAGRIAILLLAAAARTTASADTIRIEITELSFRPMAISARVGDTIEWVNDDFVAHTATARNGEWDIELLPHATGHIELKNSGELEYYCRFHPNMKGEIAVAPAMN
jgi:plastocyanin